MSAKTEKKAEEAKKTQETDAVKKDISKIESLTYLGPTIPGVIRHGAVYFDGILPGKAQKCVSEFPMMKKLFVTCDEMVKAVKELRKESALSTIYEQTAQKYTKGGK